MVWTIGRRLALGSALPALIIVIMVVGSWIATDSLGHIQDEGAQRYSDALMAQSAASLPSRLYQVIADAVINRDLKASEEEWGQIKKEADDLVAEMVRTIQAAQDKQFVFLQFVIHFFSPVVLSA